MIEWCGRASGWSLGTEKPAETIYCTSLLPELLNLATTEQTCRFFIVLLPSFCVFFFAVLVIVSAMRDSFLSFMYRTVKTKELVQHFVTE